MKALIYLLPALLVAGCLSGRSRGPSVDEKRMAAACAALIRESASAGPAARSPEVVLGDMGLSVGKFRVAVQEYNRNPRRWGGVLDQTIALLEKEAGIRADSSSPRDRRGPSSLTQPLR